MKLIFIFMSLVLTLFANEKVLYVYNWSEYMPDSVLKNFTKETGIKVKYSTYDSNEAMYAKIKTIGSSSYDVIVPSTYYVNKMSKENLLVKLDKSKLPNYKNLDKKLLSRPFDPNNDYSIPYVWGSTGISYNANLVSEKIDSWKNLWSPEYKNSILLNDDMREVFGIALKILGYSSNSTNPKEIEEAYNKLKELLPNVKMFYSESQKQVYLNEEVKLGMNFNGEGFMANEENEAIKYIYPKEGALLWIDSLVIPKGAKNIDNALAFINYLLKPEVSKIISEEIGYASPNAKTLELLDEKTRNNRMIYPNEEDLINSELQLDVGEALPVYEKYWEKLKTN
ncbi:iron(III)/spermidine/putrescine ABC transporter, periplasmic substrate-binding protein [Arcobacter venerupis]|uniref:Iron(III)/spermidine/putrescine ABC transporter, periplasmic substrate-binding protein n=1 Tax=Arcobacter venerupis TaxID=1054033 RepID=A0AAE7E3Y5_9BACT|nr:spermidine/putrescine ABC transporter substrate-binding protein [Arcobacter venerupis]QKF66116.1 iron(III)/spermidine/putrescine ABC transporter, periplasmic substrate-binding protein [Arcobacter venerupis]RWS51096.1 spermidine/putrescine ABC transporter substrate-binding protein PotD [Arcobacter venerupis]